MMHGVNDLHLLSMICICQQAIRYWLIAEAENTVVTLVMHESTQSCHMQ